MNIYIYIYIYIYTYIHVYIILYIYIIGFTSSLFQVRLNIETHMDLMTRRANKHGNDSFFSQSR